MALTKRDKRRFLGLFADLGRIDAAAQAAGIHRDTHYAWLKSDPWYAAEFEKAKEKSYDRLEDEALRRAVEGTDEPVYHGGKRVGFVRKYSDVLLIFLLKGRRPEVFRERYDLQHHGSVSLVNFVGDVMTDAQAADPEANVGNQPAEPQAGG